MTKQKTTKRALLLSALSLLMCISMLIGSTFAWFTDSVTSAGNIIKSGTLDVTMEWADGTKAIPADDSSDWTDASTGAIFNYDKWEPGYTEVRHVKISNVGSLALKYQLSITPTDEVSDLASVIDVYYMDPAAQVADRSVLSGTAPMSNLTDALTNMPATANGSLNAGESVIVTIALKMQETACNEYQNKSIGSQFAIKLNAVQLNYENDSSGSDYDKDLDPTVTYVSELDDLISAVKKGGKVALTKDITVDSADEYMYTDSNGALLYFDHVDATLDLNGHDIVVGENALMNGKSYSNAVILVRYSTLNIIGDGKIESHNKAIPVYGWAHSTINIYGGTFITNAHERNESAVYVNNPNVMVNVYGGDYSQSEYDFNAHDSKCGSTPVITLHKGVSYNDFYKGTTDLIASDMNAGRIVLADGTYLENTVVYGAPLHVVKEKVAGSTYVSTADDLYESSLQSGSAILSADTKTSDSDGQYSSNREFAIRDDKDYVIDLNGHTIDHDATYNGYTYLYTVAYRSKLTINGEGTINSKNENGTVCIVYAQSTGEVVINGGDFRTDKGVAVWAGNGSHITINGGSYISKNSGSDEELVYSSGGVIDIYGGFFHNEEWEGRPVNVADANRSTGFINIYGGTFVNFDPSTGGNDPSNIKVMDGYTVVSETQPNGDVWYTVVAE